MGEEVVGEGEETTDLIPQKNLEGINHTPMEDVARQGKIQVRMMRELLPLVQVKLNLHLQVLKMG